MRLDVEDVYFPESVRAKIHARGIDEDMVFRALTADPDLGDRPAQFTLVNYDSTGLPRYHVLARDPGSGMYLEVGLALELDGTARCFHAMRMRSSLRQRFERMRG